MAQSCSMESQLLSQIFSALKILALEVTTEDTLKVIGELPEWITQEFICQDVDSQTPDSKTFDAAAFSSFLSNFIVDAEAFWAQRADQLLRSGVWTETGTSGRDIHLEAIALFLEGRKIILIQSSELSNSEKFQWLQAAREAQLNIVSQQKEASDQLFHAT